MTPGGRIDSDIGCMPKGDGNVHDNSFGHGVRTCGHGRRRALRVDPRGVAEGVADQGLARTGRFAKEFGLYSVTTLPGEVFTAEAGFFAEHDPDTVVAPDVFFIGKDRVPSQTELEADYVRVPPDAVVEVLSPSNTSAEAEIEEKVLIYLRAGVRLVLVANPSHKTISVRTPGGSERILGIGDDLDGGDALPGFLVPVARFFPD
jgi:Uma2 family endonuclease